MLLFVLQFHLDDGPSPTDSIETSDPHKLGAMATSRRKPKELSRVVETPRRSHILTVQRRCLIRARACASIKPDSGEDAPRRRTGDN